MLGQLVQLLELTERALNVALVIGSFAVALQVSRLRRDLRRDRRWSRRSFRRHGDRLDDAERRLDRHDAALDVDTRLSS
ncbi:MAG TPA: hypothetical protein VJ783_03270 [Pirellulales bacterium]|nr:hypothetical protein [Pirellulales bacterium]